MSLATARGEINGEIMEISGNKKNTIIVDLNLFVTFLYFLDLF
jgi:hypothetical protein